MKGMKSASEEFIVPPPGRYETEIIGAEAKLSKAGATMLHLTLEIKAPEDYAGVQAHDYIITDGGAKGGGMGKKKLRGLGVNVDASDDETPDEQLAAWLLGRRLWVGYGNEQGQKKDAHGNYTIPATRTDEHGKTVPLMKLTVEEYFTHNVGGAVQATVAPQVQAPQGLPPQGFAPQGFAPVAPQGLPPQGFQGQAPGFNPGQPFAGQVPPGTGPVAPQGFAPQGFAPQGAVAPMGQLQQPVLTQAPNGQGGPGVAPPWALAPQAGTETEAKGGKRGKAKGA